ncbi:hypothetical protein AAW51_1236 [Caldimonas brevitalea]|uniref:Uncharacterized protein n=1 Tax=Caldimonas brevitalea TaxID=413882 RepID=A0A0G3BF49_9BURK|nr:hypothetical protein AAW51_1236 [Caldimonas brevitalea]
MLLTAETTVAPTDPGRDARSLQHTRAAGRRAVHRSQKRAP